MQIIRSDEPLIHHHLVDKLAFLAAIVSGVDIFPQVYAIAKSGSVANVSFTMYFLVFLNNFVWLAYAIHRGLLSVGLSAMFNIVASGMVLYFFGVA